MLPYHSSLFASSSTAPPDPIATRLMHNNDLIRQRIAELSLSNVTNQLSAVALTEPGRLNGKNGEDEEMDDEERREMELRRMLDRRRSESTHGGLKLLFVEFNSIRIQGVFQN